MANSRQERARHTQDPDQAPGPSSSDSSLLGQGHSPTLAPRPGHPSSGGLFPPLPSLATVSAPASTSLPPTSPHLVQSGSCPAPIPEWKGFWVHIIFGLSAVPLITGDTPCLQMSAPLAGFPPCFRPSSESSFISQTLRKVRKAKRQPSPWPVALGLPPPPPLPDLPLGTGLCLFSALRSNRPGFSFSSATWQLWVLREFT